MAKKLRIGFIGAGGIAVGHFQRLEAAKNAEVVAITEPSRPGLKRFQEHCPASAMLPTYRDYRVMLKKETLDAVVILSPHTLHFEQITTALRQGLHVLSEKPMTCTINHAKALIKLAEKEKRVLMISYQRHFEAPFRYMRDQIQKGALGKIEFVQAVLCQEWLRLTKGTWRQKIALSGGGQINDSGSHMIDIIMWMTGLRVAEVFAVSENFKKEVDINSTVAMTFDNGALGSLSIIGNAPTWREDHSIVGSKGALYLRQGELIQEDALGKPVKIRLPKVKSDPDANFVQSILGKESPEVPPECGLRTIEVTEAAWKSAAKGKPVRLR
jgi:predicted dehydrogenase